MSKTKVLLSLDSPIVAEVDRQAKRLNTTRSEIVRTAVMRHLQLERIIDDLIQEIGESTIRRMNVKSQRAKPNADRGR